MSAKNEMRNFREDIHGIVGEYIYEAKEYGSLDNFPLNHKQCLYIAHWGKKGMVYERNLEQLTGYTLEDFSPEDLVGYTHPEDRQIVKDITKGVVNHVINTPFFDQEPHLFLSFRFLKKDGSYCKILRQSSAFERDIKGRLVSNFSLLTDISFLETSDRVEWDFEANELDLKAFRKVIYGTYRDFFSNREKQIIELLDGGFTSQQIASNLHLSKHTVQTHRKNILRKSRSHSVDDVILFCKKNGILE